MPCSAHRPRPDRGGDPRNAPDQADPDPVPVRRSHPAMFFRNLTTRAAANPLFRRVLRNSGYLLSANALAMAGSMLQGALAARLLGVEGLGIVGLVTDFATNLNRLTSFRMGQLVVRYVGEEDRKSVVEGKRV